MGSHQNSRPIIRIPAPREKPAVRFASEVRVRRFEQDANPGVPMLVVGPATGTVADEYPRNYEPSRHSPETNSYDWKSSYDREIVEAPFLDYDRRGIRPTRRAGRLPPTLPGYDSDTVFSSSTMNHAQTSLPMSTSERAQHRRQSELKRSTSRGKMPETSPITTSRTTYAPPYVPDSPMSRAPPPTPRPSRLLTPDISDIYDDRQDFWGCHDSHRHHAVVEKELAIDSQPLPSPYAKMDAQYQAAIAHMGGRVPFSGQPQERHIARNQARNVLPEEDRKLLRLMAKGYSRGEAIDVLNENFEKAAAGLGSSRLY